MSNKRKVEEYMEWVKARELAGSNDRLTIQAWLDSIKSVEEEGQDDGDKKMTSVSNKVETADESKANDNVAVVSGAIHVGDDKKMAVTSSKVQMSNISPTNNNVVATKQDDSSSNVTNIKGGNKKRPAAITAESYKITSKKATPAVQVDGGNFDMSWAVPNVTFKENPSSIRQETNTETYKFYGSDTLRHYKFVRSANEFDSFVKIEQHGRLIDSNLVWNDTIKVDDATRVDVLGKAIDAIDQKVYKVYCVTIIAKNGPFVMSLGGFEVVVSPGEAYQILCKDGKVWSQTSCKFKTQRCIFHNKTHRPKIRAKRNKAEIELACYSSSEAIRTSLSVEDQTHIITYYPFKCPGMPEGEQLRWARNNPCKGECLAYTILQHCIYCGLNTNGDGEWRKCFNVIQKIFGKLGWIVSNESMQDDIVRDTLLDYVRLIMIPELKDFIKKNDIIKEVAKWYCEAKLAVDDTARITRQKSKKNAEAALSGKYYQHKILVVLQSDSINNIFKYSKEPRQMNSDDVEKYLDSEIQCLENPVDIHHYPKFSIVGRAASLKYGFHIQALNCTLGEIERTDRWGGERGKIKGYPLKYNSPCCVIYHHIGNKLFKRGDGWHWLYLERNGEGTANECAYDGTALSLVRIQQDMELKRYEKVGVGQEV